MSTLCNSSQIIGIGIPDFSLNEIISVVGLMTHPSNEEINYLNSNFFSPFKVDIMDGLGKKEFKD